MKIALGMIIRNLNSEKELMNYILNASMFGHKLESVIVAHTHGVNSGIAGIISKYVNLYTIDLNNPSYAIEEMQHRGISNDIIEVLCKCSVDTKRGLVPYGFNRMLVVTEAILRGIETLFFVDSDVYPTALMNKAGNQTLEKVDYFGTHLKHLNTGSDVTTGEYSGYNILPPAKFDGMDDFLDGMQKESMKHYWQTSCDHRSLVFQQEETVPVECNKVIGGNNAIKLSSFAKLPPFFSSHYVVNDEMFLCRGEDTVLGLEIEKCGIKCTDIGLNPLHDTYKNFPSEPNLREDADIQKRFYYACTGWVGRNPFFNYLLGNDIKATRESQRISLKKGLSALSKYTSNPKFNTVLQNFDASWDGIDRYISEYERTREAWNAFMERTDY